jgi:peptide subunit release factor 1 (eRF1)
VARAEAKVTREHEKAEQAASRAQRQSAQKAEKALQQRIKLASKGNKQAVRLPIAANKRKEQALEVVSDVEDPGVASAAQPVTTRHGRNIKVSNEYK